MSGSWHLWELLEALRFASLVFAAFSVGMVLIEGTRRRLAVRRRRLAELRGGRR